MLNSYFNKDHHHCCDHELHGTDNLLAKELLKLLHTIEELLKSKPEIDTSVLVDKELLSLHLTNLKCSIYEEVYKKIDVDTIVKALREDLASKEEVVKILENYPTLYAITTMLEGYATDKELSEYTSKMELREELANYLTTAEVMDNIALEIASSKADLETRLAKLVTKVEYQEKMTIVNNSLESIEDRLTVIEGGSKTTLESGNVLHQYYTIKETEDKFATKELLNSTKSEIDEKLEELEIKVEAPVTIDLSDYYQKPEADEKFADKTTTEAKLTELEEKISGIDGVEGADLSNYYKKSEVDEKFAEKTALSTLATKEELGSYATTASLSEYAQTATVESTYAKKTELANYVETTTAESTYAKSSDVDSTYAKKTDLSTYAEKSSLDNYVQTSVAESTYAKTAETVALETYNQKIQELEQKLTTYEQRIAALEAKHEE